MVASKRQIKRFLFRAYPRIPDGDRETIVAAVQQSFHDALKLGPHIHKLVERHILETRTSFRADMKAGLLWEEARYNLQPEVDGYLVKWRGKSDRKIAGFSDTEIRNNLLDLYPGCPTEIIPHILTRMRLTHPVPKSLPLHIDIAIENYARHTFTSYEIYLRVYGVERDTARDMVESEVEALLDDWRPEASRMNEDEEQSVEDFLSEISSAADTENFEPR